MGETEDFDELDGFTQHFLTCYSSDIFSCTQGSLGYVSVLVVWFNKAVDLPLQVNNWEAWGKSGKRGANQPAELINSTFPDKLQLSYPLLCIRKPWVGVCVNNLLDKAVS